MLENSLHQPYVLPRHAHDDGIDLDATILSALIGWNRRIAAAEGMLARVVEAAVSEIEPPVAAQRDMKSNDTPSSGGLSSLRVEQ